MGQALHVTPKRKTTTYLRPHKSYCVNERCCDGRPYERHQIGPLTRFMNRMIKEEEVSKKKTLLL